MVPARISGALPASAFGLGFVAGTSPASAFGLESAAVASLASGTTEPVTGVPSTYEPGSGDEVLTKRESVSVLALGRALVPVALGVVCQPGRSVRSEHLRGCFPVALASWHPCQGLFAIGWSHDLAPVAEEGCFVFVVVSSWERDQVAPPLPLPFPEEFRMASSAVRLLVCRA